ncbi:hypothetical protein BAUCODRAFT_159200 [Baudoinia panamericana UAMH 10762]|uniref:4'-phosphopantetheinyl transferase domain-containing protein n=1 Tax=Baudoinia panamericana (strain UAMH 10762) TaxID=717646 RepID=M2N4A6_BAUPA|nr:uncharacterized protein BAUCODRAFT_159200 [Baudoinia panamericana UAMH 10762]EMC93515.1 hypothetical protein BAUCODRAFT_159200 [Baudoinia panamericana UAMH 10762]
MPIRPFPLALGVGNDIAHVQRFKDVVAKHRHDPELATRRFHRFVRRLFTWRELEDFYRHPAYRGGVGRNNGAVVDDNIWRHLAGRWAAKEAVIKAVHWRRLTFKHIMVLRSHRSTKDATGPLYALILDKPAASWDSMSISRWARHSGEDLRDSEEGADHDSDAWQLPLSEAAHDTDPARANSERDVDDNSIPAGLQTDEHLTGQIAKISISHDGGFASAVCIAAEEPREGDVGGEAAAREP